MAFLKVFGKIIEYKDAEEARKIIREHALNFMLNWVVFVDKSTFVMPETKFGYEMEVQKVFVDDKEKKVKIDLTGEYDIFNHSSIIKDSNFTYQYEYGKWMIEVIPNDPFTLKKLALVQNSMTEMKKDFDITLGKNSYLYISVFPSLGVGDNYYHLPKIEEMSFPDDEFKKHEIEHREFRSDNKISHSEYIHDIITSNHPRFETLSKFCYSRTGKKPNVLVPIYNDKNTEKDVKDEKYPGFIHQDSFASGMGNGCLQVTTGMECFHLACYIYDQLIPIIPIITALSASSPFFKGKLSNFDNRFQIISQACDERKDEEKDPNSKNYIFCSRYSFIYSYLSENQYILDHHNDLPKMPINEEYYEKLRKKFTKRFSTYLCNLLVRDPMVIFDENLKLEDPNDNTHFLNLMSTNWNSLRFKPPSSNDNDNLYKVEIRPCDLQITPFENAAIVTFVMLYMEILKYYDINFIIPLSKVKENFENSVKIDAVIKEKYYWRTNSINTNYQNSDLVKFCCKKNTNSLPEDYSDPELDEKNNIKQLSLEEILNGTKDGVYIGLMKLLISFAKEKFSGSDLELILKHLEFLRLRAEGKIMTDARYLRNFILNHEDYKHNSIISSKIEYDLVQHIFKIQNAEIFPKELIID